MPERKPIFFDAQQRRWRRTCRILEISGSLLAFLLLLFAVSALSTPDLPAFLLPDKRPAAHAVKQKQKSKAARPARQGRKLRVAALGRVPQNYDPLRAAFYVSWDPSSFAALQRHYPDIDLLIPEQLHAISPTGALGVEKDQKLADWMASLDVEIPTMALVNNSDGTAWYSKELAELLAAPAARKRLVGLLQLYAVSTRQAGIALDFEEVPAASQQHFREFISELARALHRVNLKLMVALPAGDEEYDYAFTAAHADAVILMNYDQHWLSSPPGPIAAQDWFARNLDSALKRIPAEKLVVAIGNYAYDWSLPPRKQRPLAQAVTFQESLITAQESETTVEFDSDSLNPHYSYDDENGIPHQVWMLDGVTAYNEERSAERLGVQGVALWRLGSEDPSLWPNWDNIHPDNAARARLAEMPPGYDLVLEGDGDIWRITSTPKPGRRQFQYDAATDTIASENLVELPLSYTINQIGAQRGKVALTFDDGPSTRFTPQILDTLKAKRAPATFFVTGLAASNSPDLLRRIYDEGHEIGNHTYTHPRFDRISRAQLHLELNLTYRLLGSQLGIRTILFRPPYGIDHQPESASEIEQLPDVQQEGFVIVGSRIDPHDWGEAGGASPPPASVIVERVLEQARAGKGNIVLLHDGGGDRSRTVEALPQIIDGLRTEGFEIVSVSSLLNQDRATTMPPLNTSDRWWARADAFVFDLYHWLRLGIAWIFIAGIVLVSFRAVIVGLLALVEKLRPAPRFDPEFRPWVSVLIPAYNEEEVITRTVESVLASDYGLLDVIVVDDGSTDGTSECVRAAFGSDPRVRLFRQENGGKPSALNRALSMATGDIVVTIDADTAIERDAVSKLVRHFHDPRIGAVAGNAKVANRNRWLTRWQALEYITSQNLEKRAFDLLNCITVVPGAIGAWRPEAIRALGGFSPDTVAEDTDLTFALRRRGWRISYEEEAIGHTQAPETAEALIRQRFRWTYGTLQAVWKHRDTLGRPRYGTLGWIALPNVFLFQLLLPLVSPIIDLLFVSSLLLWGLAQFRITQIPEIWTAQDVERALIFFAVFLVIDILTCVVAFVLERKEDWTLLAPLLLQRFYYRQMMYVVLFRAVVRAMQGSAVGWGHVEPPVPKPAVPA